MFFSDIIVVQAKKDRLMIYFFSSSLRLGVG